MAKQVKLKAEPRSATGRSAARRLKARGIVPAVVYGGKEKSQPLQVSARDINAMLSHASGENILVELEIAGEKATRTALLQEVQHSPVGGDVLHVDFHAISMDEKIQADVPLEALGVPTGVKNFGGLLEQNLRALAIECLPRDLPAFSVMAPVIEEEPVAAEAEAAAAAGPEVITAKKEEGEAAVSAPGGKGAPAAGAKGAVAPAGKGGAPAPKEKEQKK